MVFAASVTNINVSDFKTQLKLPHFIQEHFEDIN